MASRIARARLRLLYIVFKIGLWCAEAVGEWMVRFAKLHRAVARYEGGAERAVIVIGGGTTLALWGVSRLAFLAVYLPTDRIQKLLSAAGGKSDGRLARGHVWLAGRVSSLGRATSNGEGGVWVQDICPR
jgi:hypothetical protein